MNLLPLHRLLTRSGFTLMAGLMLAPCASARRFTPDIPDNPISKMARLVNPKLAEVEDRVKWLTREAYTLAKYQQFPLRYNVGYRGHRAGVDQPDPSIVMDFGKVQLIDDVYLIPTQREFLNDNGIFPKCFTIEISDNEDFADAQLVYSTGDKPYDKVDGLPVAFNIDRKGRYLRLSVQRGHNQGTYDVYGLSEMFVFSEGQPISFNAKIRTTGDLDISPVWHPHALNDGRSPLGIWHHGRAIDEGIGDKVKVTTRGASTSWQVDLDATQAIDQIILFPYQILGSQCTSVLPDTLRIQLETPGEPDSIMVRDWGNPLPGSTQHTPMVFAFGGMRASKITITATSYWIMSERTLHALAEIEIWSGGTNLIAGKPVTRTSDGKRSQINTLSDGHSSERSIIPIQSWLNQLTKRDQISQELASLRSIHTQLSTRAELNVSWGSAVLLGLTFLIPVFIFERKRNKSKEHLDVIRKRIAADLHDDIGSNLGSISMIARTARKDLARLNGPAEIDNDLGEVELIARESSLAMRDIVWLLERKQDSIGDLIHRMRETAGRLLRGTKITFECNSTKTAAKLTLDAKRHLFLFYKEAIHNIVKHSKANDVKIRLWDDSGDRLGMEIIDNGVGLPVNSGQSSVTVKKLEERSGVIGGTLEIDSSPEKGTSIRLLVKRMKLTNPSRST